MAVPVGRLSVRELSIQLALPYGHALRIVRALTREGLPVDFREGRPKTVDRAAADIIRALQGRPVTDAGYLDRYEKESSAQHPRIP